MDNPVVNQMELYRLPWTMPDNGITWLEPTAQCNLNCYGCYRKNVKNSHKPLEEVKHELDFFQSVRKTDCISIAGGDPLLLPSSPLLAVDVEGKSEDPRLLEFMQEFFRQSYAVRVYDRLQAPPRSLRPAATAE